MATRTRRALVAPAGEDATITEASDAIATIGSDVAALTEQIKELDKSVATATESRKAEHAEYTETQTLNEAANALVEKAKQRLYKFSVICSRLCNLHSAFLVERAVACSAVISCSVVFFVLEGLASADLTPG